MGLHRHVHARLKGLGRAVASRARVGLALADRGLYHAGRLAHALPEDLVHQVAGPEAGEVLRAAKRGLHAYEGVRQLATGSTR